MVNILYTYIFLSEKLFIVGFGMRSWMFYQKWAVNTTWSLRISALCSSEHYHKDILADTDSQTLKIPSKKWLVKLNPQWNLFIKFKILFKSIYLANSLYLMKYSSMLGNQSWPYVPEHSWTIFLGPWSVVLKKCS